MPTDADAGNRIFLELPPVLAHYLERGRNIWLQSSPQAGHLSFLNRPGIFVDLEAKAVERRQLITVLGHHRGRALCYRIGFEQGRRDAARHFNIFESNARLALQAGAVFGQLRGYFVADCTHLDLNMREKTFYRKIRLKKSAEAFARRMISEKTDFPVCWEIAGYLSGHASEIIGRRIITLESRCYAKGDPECWMESKPDAEWGTEADWVREALRMKTVDEEIGEASPAAVEQAPPPPVLKATESLTLETMVADSASMRPVMSRARHVADSNLPVLLTGLPGTGRETLARAIHFVGQRAEGPFETVDCAGADPEMMTRSIFGFEAGAFPGASKSFKGAVHRARQGTLYLANVDQLDLEAQGLLMRLLKEGKTAALGADEPAVTDIRLMAGTQADLARQVETSSFKEELYYALRVGAIDLPSLTEREGDILRMAEQFLLEFAARYQRPAVNLTEDARHALLDCAWPGNVRQLRNAIEHAVVFSEAATIGLDALPEEVLAGQWRRPAQQITKEVIQAALRRARGNRSKAAHMLGIGRTTLWRHMKRFDLDV